MAKTKEQISYNMSRVKNKNSKIEMLLRKELWNRGLRYQKNVKTIMGKPDIVFKEKKIAVFCDSEFWHGYDWDNRKNDIKSNRDFWIAKIERNMQRDVEVTEYLENSGWNPKTLQYLMGHSDISVTMNVYTHIGFDDAEEELKQMEEFRKAQAEVEQKKEKPMSQKMFKVI